MATVTKKESNKKKTKKIKYQDRIKAGKCGIAGCKNKPKKNSVTGKLYRLCEEHRAKKNAYMVAFMEQRKKEASKGKTAKKKAAKKGKAPKKKAKAPAVVVKAAE